MKIRLIVAAMAAAAAFTPVTYAAGTGWYLGFGVGQSKARDIDDISGYAEDLEASLVEELPGLSIDINASSDDKDTGWKIYAGYRLNKNFAVEGGYVHLGKFGYNASYTGSFVEEGGTVEFTGAGSVKARAKAWTLGVLGILPVSDSFEVFGKVGAAFWDVKTTATATATAEETLTLSDSVSKSGTGLNFGLGAVYNINKNLGVRLEWERFNDVGKEETTGKSDIDLISLGLKYSF